MTREMALMQPYGACRTDNEATGSLFASHGASKSLQANVNRILRSFPANSGVLRDYEMTPAIQTEIVKWVMDYFYGESDFPYPYAPNIARLLESTVKKQITNEVYDEKIVQQIQSASRFVKTQRPSRCTSGEEMNWSIFPRFYIVPLGYPINNIEERFAKLVGWQLASFQQRTTTLNTFYVKRLNTISGDWMIPEHVNVDLNSWDERSLYMNDCYEVMQRAEGRCESVIEEYVVRFVREANVFVDNVQNNVGQSGELFEDYKNMQLNNLICCTYGYMRKLSTEFAAEFHHLKSSMLLAGDTAGVNLLQSSLENKKRCENIEWADALNWLGITLSKSMLMFMGCDKTKEQKIKRLANDPASTGTPPPFNHVFFGRHKVFDFATAERTSNWHAPSLLCTP